MNIQIQDQKLDQVLFYTLEKAIKSYRQFAQRRLNELDHDITIDQWLTLKTISDNPGIPQREIANRVFKDQASITRLIDALVQKGYLMRNANKEDRRRYSLDLSESGQLVLSELQPVIQWNRNTALQDINSKEVINLRQQLEKIIENCKS